MEPFFISCTTCRARLKVRSADAIGQIQACPKCGSMVLVQRPVSMEQPISPVASVAPVAGPLLAATFDDAADLLSDAEVGSAGADELAVPPVPTRDAVAAPAVDPVVGQVDETERRVAGESVTGALPDSLLAAESPAALPPPLPSPNWSLPLAGRLPQLALLAGAALVGVLLAVGAIRLVVFQRAPAGVPTSPQATDAHGRQPVTSTEPDARANDAPAKAAVDERASHEAAASVSSAADHVGGSVAGDSGPALTTRPFEAAPATDAGGQSATTDNGVRVPGDSATNSTGANLAGAGPPGLVPLGDDELPGSSTLDEDPILSLLPEPASSAPAGTLQPPARAAGPKRQTRSFDIQKQLSVELSKIEFQKTPLADFAAFAAQLSTIPITLDLDELAVTGRSAESPISISLERAQLGQILTTALQPHGLKFVARERDLLITRDRETAQTRELKYALDDLSDMGPSAWGELLESLVEPASWGASGGAASWAAAADSLVVRQRDANHYLALSTLERIRIARGLPVRTKLPVPRTKPVSRWDAVEPKLQTTVSLNFGRPTSLRAVLERLAKETDTRLLVDWGAFAEMGWFPDTPLTLTVQAAPLPVALAALLDPLDAAFRVVDARTLEISSLRAIDERIDIEFFPADDLLVRRDAATVKQQVTQWLEQRDTTGGHFAVHVDAPSRYVVIVAPPRLQILFQQARLRGRAPR